MKPQQSATDRRLAEVEERWFCEHHTKKSEGRAMYCWQEGGEFGKGECMTLSVSNRTYWATSMVRTSVIDM